MKDILRARLKQIRGNISNQQKAEAEKLINKNLISFCKNIAHKNCFWYYPFASEVNILDAIKQVNAHGTRSFFPATTKDSLSFFTEWDSINPEYQVSNGFIKADNLTAEEISPEIIFIPCLGYDRRGYRIGYGNGYYDKILPKYPTAKKVIVAFSVQELLEIPEEPHDIAADFIINEKEIIEVSVE